jgi:hypothetical protein
MGKDKIRIFDYCWHPAHQWDLVQALKEDCTFTYGLNVKRHWDASSRPLPGEVRFVTHYEPGAYDVAILHIDQQVVEPFHQKRMVYEQFNSVITDIPKIVINHATPVNPEGFGPECSLSLQEMEHRCVEGVRSLVGENLMVVNSYAAAGPSEWGFGYPIVHGMDPAEWYDLPKEPRVFTALSPRGLDTYYNRDTMIRASDILFDEYGYVLCYARLNVDFGDNPEAYKHYLGKSLVYLDTSVRTPMNRARTEAFLSGCCVVQVEGAHDLERWAVPGENIILVPDDPAVIARTIAGLLEERYTEALSVGQRGREMALREFSRERYRADWLRLLQQVMSQKITS